MKWYLCLLLAILAAVFSVRMALRKRMGRMRILYALLGCLAIAFVLYIPPFFSKYDPAAALLGCLVNTLQVISLDADYLVFYELIAAELGMNLLSYSYFILLGLIHLVLPAVSAMTAVTLVVRCLAELQIRSLKRRKNSIYILSEVNYKSATLARDIRANEPKADILFLTEDDNTEFTDLQQELHCSVINERIENVKAHAKRRNVHYYCISEDERVNLPAALAIVAWLNGQEKDVQKNNYVYLFTADPAVELLVDSVPKGIVNVTVIDEDRTDAYRLLERYPLPHYGENGLIHMLICGFGPMSEAVLRAASWCGQLEGWRLKISVIDRDLEERADSFRCRFPGLFTDRYDIRFYSYRLESEFRSLLEAHCADANYIVAACADERQTVDRAVFLRRFFYRLDGSFSRKPPVFAYMENSDMADAVSALTTAETRPDRRMSYGIIPFGMASELYSMERITRSDLELLSKNVHLVYEDIFSEGEIDVVPALERYNLFEVNKRSNRANALHIRYKLAMLGLDYTDGPEGEEVDLAACLDPELLERLTRAEHDRWEAFLESEGWEPSTVEEADLYKASGLSKGRHNCPLLRLHPYLCPFDELKDRSDRLGLPDSTVYDRDLITRIPDILGDKWNVSGKKWRIIKRDSEQGG